METKGLASHRGPLNQEEALRDVSPLFLCRVCGRRLWRIVDSATGAVVAWRCVMESVDGQGVWWHA